MSLPVLYPSVLRMDLQARPQEQRHLVKEIRGAYSPEAGSPGELVVTTFCGCAFEGEIEYVPESAINCVECFTEAGRTEIRARHGLPSPAPRRI